MASSLHQWESDPLFSAAEVVQDSADRMDSLFRLLLHDQNLVQGDHPDPRLLMSIENHKRDLATILETAKWQLEDFERAVNSSAMQDKSRSKEDVISRHCQFIRAIREQINHVETSVDGPSMGDSMKNSEWINLNEQDRDGLALFLIGGNTTEHSNHHDMEDSSILRRFLDRTSSSSLKDDEIVEHGNIEFKNLKMNGDVHADHHSVKEKYLRKMDSPFPTRLSSDMQEISCNRQDDTGNWDLEANDATSKSVFCEKKFRAFQGRMNFRFLNNLWAMSGSRVTKSYIKRLKDGEEQRQSTRYTDVSASAQGQCVGPRLGYRSSSLEGLFSRFRANLMVLFSSLGARYQIFPFHLPINRHTIQMIFTIIFALIFLGILVSRIA
ncbi:hypothetical protein P3X46_004200 [Hevea brasiliensis]|uniref:Syntaxin 6/10/61 N-terminal domain-containing protein n=1 Tax=Hevea brasiliensis TaxID=3981 RepID=A0ABQ9MZV9_HEVBR|nr:uncharacterized protein LOC110649880 [Hevea brasiliensis]XP_021660315.2 uncharacterized protein LOC110649880 [Hevea brasiliensis]KAJ9184480.1 hypothetical protein P3X46_004200 [Hevea brasiliensis]